MADIFQRTAEEASGGHVLSTRALVPWMKESREQAIQVLGTGGRKERQVGIISHVEELKKQLDRKLVIRKDREEVIFRLSAERCKNEKALERL